MPTLQAAHVHSYLAKVRIGGEVKFTSYFGKVRVNTYLVLGKVRVIITSLLLALTTVIDHKDLSEV